MLRKQTAFILIAFSLLAVAPQFTQAQKAKTIYQKGWIDLNKNGRMDIYEDPSAPIDARITDLLSQMTVEEKTCQLATLYGYGRVAKDELPTPQWKEALWKDGIANIDEHLNGLVKTQYSYPFSKHAEAINTVQRWFIEETRLGIPVDFSNEGIHGLNHDRATPLPAPIAIGSTWNKALVRQAGEIVGREGKALGYTNIYAPILDLARDPRWGRVLECYGEEPYHVAALGKEMVAGIQSNGIAATLKHFAVYSVPKGGRDGHARTDPHVAPREMHQLHLYPYRKIIREVRPMGVMSSYNDYDGIPVSGSYYFLTELLREKYGFDGYVVSDSEAVEFVYSKHRVAQDMKGAVKQVVEAGLNVKTNFTQPSDFILPLRELINEGSVSMQTLDRNVADVLRVKFRLGLFDQPYVTDTKAADKIVASADTKDFELEMAKQSLVLLKNENNLLPLDLGKLGNILVTGPLAMDTTAYVSRYGPQNMRVTPVLEGIRNYVGSAANVHFAKGCEVVDATWPESEIIPTPLTDKEQQQIREAVDKARQCDIVIAVLGEDEHRVGESKSRTGLGLPGRQFQFLQALHETGKPIVLVLINGQPLTINWEDRYIPAILEAWFPSPVGGKAIAGTLFGEYNPGGKLSVTFPKTLGQIELNFPFKPGSHAGQPGDGPNGYGKTAVVGSLYPFGYGLSYTTFEYKNLRITPPKQGINGQINISFDITNTGTRAGDEVVQLYVRDPLSTVISYDSQLRGFERVALKPGETKAIHFTLLPEDLEMLDRDMHWIVEPGLFEILIGSSSEDIRLHGECEMELR
ncbi:glycoside hydrolase family 3 N-terminal domain-containing protein [Bacteroides sp. 51]|uniref:glycoside hydrolase family 3 N-terminal domain-containing protein n=1 Tax=Bacteroides sp. 51 TaxID=2302938 RepID=UPI0013D38C8D|nr:glycoside hydrolase family 3 N-terminal domain-containing protein [Bacteroides sp. 51]NDV80473.1 beta-glucosidase [Bacteroides sp. 51]